MKYIYIFPILLICFFCHVVHAQPIPPSGTGGGTPVGTISTPVVTTSAITIFDHVSATMGGNVSDDGGASVTERGVVYNTSGSPTTTDTKVQIDEGTGVFSKSVNGLSEGTTYYVKAYAVNSEGTSYGDQVSFTTLDNTVYVNSSTGNDTSGDGSSDNPYKTFHKGYSVVNDGGILNLTGTFTWTDADEIGDIVTDGYTLGKNVTIQGQGAGSTIVQADATANTADRRIFTISSSYTISIKDLTLRYGNLASNGRGGAVYVGSITTDVTIDGCILELNAANASSYTYSYGGGALCYYNSNASGGNLIINNSIIRNNTAANCWGGAIYSYRNTSGTGSVVIDNTTISGNTAANGTALSGYFGAFIITNSTITANYSSYCMIMSNHNYGLFYMTNVTFAYNDLGTSASGLYLENVADIRIKNSILAQNKRTDNSVYDYYRTGGNLNESTYNIIEKQGVNDFTNDVNGNIVGEQSCLGLSSTLDINGSSGIAPTLALSESSIAANAGTSSANGSVDIPAFDQRGITRYGLTDIGAYELQTDVVSPEINITGNGNAINNGATSTSETNFTDFGSVVATGDEKIVKTFTISNVGNDNLNLTGTSPYVTISGSNAADFSITTIPSTPIAASGSTTFGVTFNPSASGVRTATLSILNNDCDEDTYTFTIRGTGLNSAPSVSTAPITTLGATSAAMGGNVTDDGGAAVTDRGVVYSSGNTNPEIGGTSVSRASIESGTGVFSKNITGLVSYATYYVKAYAINAVDTTYGSVESFTTQDSICPSLTVPDDIHAYADADQCGTVVPFENEILDVSQSSYNTGIGETLKSQSFRAEKTGKLTKVQLFKNGVGAYEITLSIYKGDGIDGDILYSDNYSISYSTNGWFDLVLPFEGAPFLVAGNDYTFSLSNDNINLLISSNDPYALGRFYTPSYSGISTYDLMFKTYITQGVIASDNAGDPGLEQTNGLPSGSVFPVGETINTFVATDEAGNRTEKSFKVIVEDNIAPQVMAKDTTIYLNSDGIAVLTPESVDRGSYDNCGIDTMYLSQDTFDCSLAGYVSRAGVVGLKSTATDGSGTGYRVWLMAEDTSGNSSEDLFYVTVLDTIAPDIKTKNITVYLDGSGLATLDSLAIDNGSADACGLAGFELSKDTFYCENVGDNTVSLTVIDVHGNTASQTATVTVKDEIYPVAFAKDTTIYLSSDGIAVLTPESVDRGSYDNCGIDTMYLSQDTFDCSLTGYVSRPGVVGLKSTATDGSGTGYRVWLTVGDASGNFAEDLFYVTVLDTIAPDVKTKDITVYLDGSGLATLDSLAIDNGSFDACGIASIIPDTDVFSCNDIGANEVTLTVTDIHGNTASQTATVTVKDEIYPVAFAKDTTIYLNSDGIAVLTPESVDRGSYDNCGIDTMYLSQDTFDCSLAGYVSRAGVVGLKSTATDGSGTGYRVWLTVGDASGNFAEDLFYVTVLDTIAPDVNTKNITVYLDGSGLATLDSLAIDNGSADACGLAGFELSKDTFYCENVGDNTVSLTVIDVHGNTSVKSSTVTVVDNRMPVVIAKDTTIYLNSNGIATIGAASIDAGSYDNCNIDSMYLSQDTFDCSYVGYAPANNIVELKSIEGRRPAGSGVWLTVIDASGNSDKDLFYVSVEDTIAPEVQTKDIVVYLGEDGIKTISPAMIVEASYDACGIESMALSKSTFEGPDAGANKVILTATDINGNTSFYSSIVTVLDTIAPEVQCQNFSIVLDEEGTSGIYPDLAIESAYDAGGIASISVDKMRFNCSNLGENTITVTMKDYGGNIATCNSTVTISDRYGPEVLCQNLNVSLNAQGLATIGPEMVDVGSSDVCGIAEMRLSKSEFTGADLGENQVSLLVTDMGGNIDSCMATITVTDPIAPEVNCNAINVELLSGSYQLTENDIAALAAGSSDNATPTDKLVVEVSPSVFTCDQIGDSITVEVTVTDESGNAGKCETKVYVGFVLNAELVDVEVSLDSGRCETTVDYPAIFTTESCAGLTLIDGLGADGIFPAGTSVETWEVVLGKLTDTVSFAVIVSSENLTPTLAATADTTVLEDEELIVELTGIGDGGDCVAQALEVRAESQNSGLIKTIEINYEPGSSTAELLISLVTGQSGKEEVVVTVEDEAGATVADTFVVIVEPVNDAPVLVAAIADREVQAGAELSISLSSLLGDVFTDADGDELTWSFIPEIDTVYNWMNVREFTSEYILDFAPTPADTGCYNIIVQVSDPAGATASDTFKVCVTAIPVGVVDLSSGNFEVKMYPNPTKGLVNIELESTFANETEISVSNVAGAEVFRRSYISGDLIQVDLSENVSGIYLIRVIQGGNQVIKKLILDKN